MNTQSDAAAEVAREKKRQQRKDWKRRNPEKVKASKSAWNARYREREAEKKREKYRNDPFAAAAATERWRSFYDTRFGSDRDALRKYWRENFRRYYAKNREKVLEACCRYRLARKAARANTSCVPGEIFRTRLHTNEIYRIASAAVSSRLPNDVRDDVISDLCLALIAGDISVSDVEQFAKTCIRAHFKGRDWHRSISLDAPVRGQSDLRLIDMIDARADHV